jgi:molybdopterin synthase catalytic subunit
MRVSYDPELLKLAVAEVEAMPGICGARIWINEGTLQVGEEMIWALVAGDLRRNVLPAWEALMDRVNSEVVTKIDIPAQHS